MHVSWGSLKAPSHVQWTSSFFAHIPFSQTWPHWQSKSVLQIDEHWDFPENTWKVILSKQLVFCYVAFKKTECHIYKTYKYDFEVIDRKRELLTLLKQFFIHAVNFIRQILNHFHQLFYQTITCKKINHVWTQFWFNLTLIWYFIQK